LFEAVVRYRTVGDMICTGAVQSSASTEEEIIEEVAATRITERGATRANDRASEAAMEDRKREGYFRWTFFASPQRGAPTTGSPPCSGGSCTTPKRSSRISWRPSNAPHATAAPNTPTCRC